MMLFFAVLIFADDTRKSSEALDSVSNLSLVSNLLSQPPELTTSLWYNVIYFSVSLRLHFNDADEGWAAEVDEQERQITGQVSDMPRINFTSRKHVRKFQVLIF